MAIFLFVFFVPVKKTGEFFLIGFLGRMEFLVKIFEVKFWGSLKITLKILCSFLEGYEKLDDFFVGCFWVV